jgi:prevent-host-death family protein
MEAGVMTTTVNIHDAKTHFSKLLQRVFNGEEVIIAKAGEPVAILSPLPSQMTRRVPGNDAGKVTITPVFEESLPEFDEI